MAEMKILDVFLSIGENAKRKVGEIGAESWIDAKSQIVGLLREAADYLENGEESPSEPAE